MWPLLFFLLQVPFHSKLAFFFIFFCKGMNKAACVYLTCFQPSLGSFTNTPHCGKRTGQAPSSRIPAPDQRWPQSRSSIHPCGKKSRALYICLHFFSGICHSHLFMMTRATPPSGLLAPKNSSCLSSALTASIVIFQENSGTNLEMWPRA